MPYTPKILAFAGSLRTGSWNKKLIRIAAQAAERAGAEVTLVDLRDYPMPVLDQDIEKAEGIPEHGQRLKDLMIAHHGFLIASAEYNSSITAALKNAIDWASRPSSPDEKGLIAFKGKVAGLMSASPGALGGLRGLVHLRAILGNIGVLVLPEQKAISQASKAFTEDGTSLLDSTQQQAIEDLAGRLVDVCSKLKAE
jgi:NAD(P)H-dependent FMN reductase